jgi:glycerol uptake facilitator-like aquaporin
MDHFRKTQDKAVKLGVSHDSLMRSVPKNFVTEVIGTLVLMPGF